MDNTELADGSIKIQYNVNFSQISQLLGQEVNFGEGKPLTAAVHCNRFLWSSAKLGCDLYLPSPMGVLIGDKLYESGKALVKDHDIVESLKARVEFPDIRQLVNKDQLKFIEVLTIRAKASKFRGWLQSEADRDRDQIIAYHNELGKELGIKKAARKTLKIFGIIGGSSMGALIGSTVGDPMGAAAGSASGAATAYVLELASKIGAEWRPVVFGDWLKERISKVTQR